MRIVSEAIRESLGQDKIARIDSIDSGRAGVDLESVHAELLSECEGCAGGVSEVEYWGVTCDGDKWRVRVSRGRAPCAYCGKPAEGNYGMHRDGFDVGPEVDLCDECSDPELTCETIWDRIAQPSDDARAHRKRL